MPWNEGPREIQAHDAATGQRLWKIEGTIVPLTMAVNDQRLVYSNGKEIVSLDRATGQQQWTSEPTARCRIFRPIRRACTGCRGAVSRPVRQAGGM